MKLSEELKERGFIHQFSGESLENILDGEKRTFYFGVDPTAASVHIGNLVGYMFARHLIDAGHTPIMLLGGGTGMIGDPRDTAERPMSDTKEVQERTDNLISQAKGLMGSGVQIVNNADWLAELNLIEFLRDVGKHFTVNKMIKKEIVAKRLADESPISYTEFAYAPLQAFDFLHLYKAHGCTLQISGSDQWGNVMSGIELIRKKEHQEAYGLTAPLIVDKASGRKFGKSEGNAVWLDAAMTSPYAFYQFWLNVTDEDVIERLKIFTLLSLSEIAKLGEDVQVSPQDRAAQKTLAYEVTKFVHGEAAAEAAQSVSSVLFGGQELGELSDTEVEMLKTEAPVHKMANGAKLVDTLVESKLVSSKTEARTMIEQGAVSISGVKITDVEFDISEQDLESGIAILRKGKKQLMVLTL